MGKRLAVLEKEKVYDRAKHYNVADAAAAVKKTATAKFDETIELHVKLGVDPKQSDQNVRGTVVLPNGTGKSKKVVVVAKGEKLKEAEAAGADLAGDADVIDKIAKGWLDFDVLVATPDAMKEAVADYLERGFRAIKFGWGAFGDDIARDVALVRAARCSGSEFRPFHKNLAKS